MRAARAVVQRVTLRHARRLDQPPDAHDVLRALHLEKHRERVSRGIECGRHFLILCWVCKILFGAIYRVRVEGTVSSKALTAKVLTAKSEQPKLA